MPSRRCINSLSVLCEDSFAEYFVRCWEEYWIDGRGDRHFLQLLRFIPYSIANTIVFKILRLCIDQRRRGYYRICDLLSSFYIANLTFLDLSHLVGIGPRSEHHLKKFERTVLSWLPRLKKLTKLNLRTHTLQTTLPICSDDILQGIGHYMKGLRILDVSKNNLVTDYGLEYLLPTDGQFGCPLLEELFVFECSVTVEGVAHVLRNLDNLRILGFKETGEALKYLFDNFSHESNGFKKKLRLTHVNNLGSSGLVNHLGCNNKLVKVLSEICPDLINLKVRIADENMPLLQKFNKLKVLEIFYYETTPHLEMGSADYFRVSGHHLYSITLQSSTFSSRYFAIIGESCPNLRKFWFTCYSMNFDTQFETNLNREVFKCLETLYFRVGFSEADSCDLSLPLFRYILQNTNHLTDLRLICRSTSLTDTWLKNLWKCFKPDKLEKVLIALPFLNNKKNEIPLTMLSVNLILEQSSCLQYLGNLLVWDVSYQEMKNLKTYLDMCNFNVNLVYYPMKIK